MQEQSKRIPQPAPAGAFCHAVPLSESPRSSKPSMVCAHWPDALGISGPVQTQATCDPLTTWPVASFGMIDRPYGMNRVRA